MRKPVAIGIIVVIVGLVCYVMATQDKQRGSPPTKVAAAPSASDPRGSAKKPMRGPAGSPKKRPPLAASRAMSAQASAARKAAGQDKGKGVEAIRRAARARKHLFVLFYQKDDKETRAVRKTLESAVRKMGRTAQWIAIDKNAASEKEVVEKFAVKTAPMPLVLAVAPNGAITGGFLGAAVTERKLQGAIASQGMQKCLKALQAHKLVFLCLQNGRTRANKPGFYALLKYLLKELFEYFFAVAATGF